MGNCLWVVSVSQTIFLRRTSHLRTDTQFPDAVLWLRVGVSSFLISYQFDSRYNRYVSSFGVYQGMQ